MKPPLRCLELFSGIGGMSFALEAAGVNAEVLLSVDINHNANHVHRANFGNPILSKSIEYLSWPLLRGYNLDIWVMSPPCQPFTRGGKHLDHLDHRSKALLHVISLLDSGSDEDLPSFLFLENVLNFERSKCREMLIDVLKKKDYLVVECLLEPVALGWPNRRLRYYLMARKGGWVEPRLHTELPLRGQIARQDTQLGPTTAISTRKDYTSIHNHIEAVEVAPLSDFLDPSVDRDDFALPHDWVLRRPGFRFDIVTASSRTSACFTRSYGTSHIFGSGSYIRTQAPEEVPLPLYTEVDVDLLRGARLRQGALNMCRRTQYRLLGNSVSVTVIAELFKVLFCEHISNSAAGP